MLQVDDHPLIIKPQADLLAANPRIAQEATALGNCFVNNKVVSDERLQSIGAALWNALCIDDAFETALQNAGNKILPILIESQVASIQNLPWETLYHPKHGFLGQEQRFSLSRRIASDLHDAENDNHTATQHNLEPGPLRVLLFSALPEDLNAERGRLEVEEEQEHVVEALFNAVTQGQVRLETPDDGRLSTLETQLKTFNPHLVFLSGHGRFHQPLAHENKQPYGTFLLENEQGFSEEITDQALAKVFVGSAVQCVVLSACESGKAASDALNNGLARRLIEQQITHVVGMRESILDRAGILFAHAFCEAIGDKERVDVAIQRARKAIQRPLSDETADATGIETGDTTWRDQRNPVSAELSLGQWSLPTLFSREASSPLIDWQFSPQALSGEFTRSHLDGVSLPAKFRGRRKELRHFSAGLIQGKIKQLLITGPGGQGKTALAGKLALEMRQAGIEVIAWNAKEGEHFSQFIFDLQLKLNPENTKNFDRVQAEFTDTKTQIKYLLQFLLHQYQNRLLIFLDNLESLQTIQSLALNDKDAQCFIDVAKELEPTGLSLLLTSRWEIPDWPKAHHWQLEPMSYGDFLQLCLLQDHLNSLADRRHRLRRVYQVLNGNGRGLEFFAAAVKKMKTSEEDQFLNALADAEAEVQTDMALEKLLSQYSETELQLLSRMQWFEEPVPIEGVLQIADKLPRPQEIVAALTARSLLEVSHHPHWFAKEYHAADLVTRAVNKKLDSSPNLMHGKLAAEYQGYLYHNERKTLHHAQLVFRALQQAHQQEEARLFALDNIVGPLSRGGHYQLLLKDWLPEIRETRDQKTLGRALNQTGLQYLHLGEYNEALNYFEQSLTITQEIGDRSTEGATLSNMSAIFQARGDYDKALGYLEQSLTITQEIGDRLTEGATLNNMSTIAHARGDYDKALRYLEQSLAIAQEVGDRSGEGTTLNNMATIAHARSDYDKALGYLEQSLAIQQEIGDRSGEGTTLNNMSTIAHARGDYDKALGYLEQSLAIRQEIGDARGLCATLINIGHINWQNDEQDKAFATWLKAYELAKKINFAQALEALEGLAEQLGLPGGLKGWEALLIKSKNDS